MQLPENMQRLKRLPVHSVEERYVLLLYVGIELSATQYEGRRYRLENQRPANGLGERINGVLIVEQTGCLKLGKLSIRSVHAQTTAPPDARASFVNADNPNDLIQLARVTTFSNDWQRFFVDWITIRFVENVLFFAKNLPP